MDKKFITVSANEENPKWEQIVSRVSPIYVRDGELRTEFGRDYTRIIFSNSYRRLKHKTQVFFSPEDDHICTRIEHVNNVESISYTIASSLGLNTELTKAISVAHDLGHSPFGHQGEKILNEISKKDIGETFWHEQNGVYLVDKIELLEDYEGSKQNLNLTYAVRDGIISHCGEIDEASTKPRQEFIDLYNYTKPNEYAPYTWEACIVKIADKISYIGRDIEDAVSLKIIDYKQTEELKNLFQNKDVRAVNNSSIIHELAIDLYRNSSIENGLMFSEAGLNLINKIKEFNYKNIYFDKSLTPSLSYFNLVINEIYNLFKSAYDKENTINNLQKLTYKYGSLIEKFVSWLENYIDLGNREEILKNKVVFNPFDEKSYSKAIITYISGMTDQYAEKAYHSIISC